MAGHQYSENTKDRDCRYIDIDFSLSVIVNYITTRIHTGTCVNLVLLTYLLTSHD